MANKENTAPEELSSFKKGKGKGWGSDSYIESLNKKDKGSGAQDTPDETAIGWSLSKMLGSEEYKSGKDKLVKAYQNAEKTGTLKKPLSIEELKYESDWTPEQMQRAVHNGQVKRIGNQIFRQYAGKDGKAETESVPFKYLDDNGNIRRYQYSKIPTPQPEAGMSPLGLPMMNYSFPDKSQDPGAREREFSSAARESTMNDVANQGFLSRFAQGALDVPNAVSTAANGVIGLLGGNTGTTQRGVPFNYTYSPDEKRYNTPLGSMTAQDIGRTGLDIGVGVAGAGLGGAALAPLGAAAGFMGAAGGMAAPSIANNFQGYQEGRDTYAGAFAKSALDLATNAVGMKVGGAVAGKFIPKMAQATSPGQLLAGYAKMMGAEVAAQTAVATPSAIARQKMEEARTNGESKGDVASTAMQTAMGQALFALVFSGSKLRAAQDMAAKNPYDANQFREDQAQFEYNHAEKAAGVTNDLMDAMKNNPNFTTDQLKATVLEHNPDAAPYLGQLDDIYQVFKTAGETVSEEAYKNGNATDFVHKVKIQNNNGKIEPVWTTEKVVTGEPMGTEVTTPTLDITADRLPPGPEPAGMLNPKKPGELPSAPEVPKLPAYDIYKNAPEAEFTFEPDVVEPLALPGKKGPTLTQGKDQDLSNTLTGALVDNPNMSDKLQAFKMVTAPLFDYSYENNTPNYHDASGIKRINSIITGVTGSDPAQMTPAQIVNTMANITAGVHPVMVQAIENEGVSAMRAQRKVAQDPQSATPSDKLVARGERLAYFNNTVRMLTELPQIQELAKKYSSSNAVDVVANKVAAEMFGIKSSLNPEATKLAFADNKNMINASPAELEWWKTSMLNRIDPQKYGPPIDIKESFPVIPKQKETGNNVTKEAKTTSAIAKAKAYESTPTTSKKKIDNITVGVKAPIQAKTPTSKPKKDNYKTSATTMEVTTPVLDITAERTKPNAIEQRVASGKGSPVMTKEEKATLHKPEKWKESGKDTFVNPDTGVTVSKSKSGYKATDKTGKEIDVTATDKDTAIRLADEDSGTKANLSSVDTKKSGKEAINAIHEHLDTVPEGEQTLSTPILKKALNVLSEVPEFADAITLKVKGDGSAGKGSHQAGEITLPPNASPEHVAHEVMHSVTSSFLHPSSKLYNSLSPKLRKNLTKVAIELEQLREGIIDGINKAKQDPNSDYNKAIEEVKNTPGIENTGWIDSDFAYPLSNTKELIAALKTNPEFRTILESIKAPNQKLNFFQKLRRVFSKTVAVLSGKDYSALPKSSLDALDALFDKGFSRIYNTPTKESFPNSGHTQPNTNIYKSVDNGDYNELSDIDNYDSMFNKGKTDVSEPATSKTKPGSVLQDLKGNLFKFRFAHSWATGVDFAMNKGRSLTETYKKNYPRLDIRLESAQATADALDGKTRVDKINARVAKKLKVPLSGDRVKDTKAIQEAMIKDDAQYNLLSSTTGLASGSQHSKGVFALENAVNEGERRFNKHAMDNQTRLSQLEEKLNSIVEPNGKDNPGLDIFSKAAYEISESLSKDILKKKPIKPPTKEDVKNKIREASKDLGKTITDSQVNALADEYEGFRAIVNDQTAIVEINNLSYMGVKSIEEIKVKAAKLKAKIDAINKERKQIINPATGNRFVDDIKKITKDLTDAKLIVGMSEMFGYPLDPKAKPFVKEVTAKRSDFLKAYKKAVKALANSEMPMLISDYTVLKDASNNYTESVNRHYLPRWDGKRIGATTGTAIYEVEPNGTGGYKRVGPDRAEDNWMFMGDKDSDAIQWRAQKTAEMGLTKTKVPDIFENKDGKLFRIVDNIDFTAHKRHALTDRQFKQDLAAAAKVRTNYSSEEYKTLVESAKKLVESYDSMTAEGLDPDPNTTSSYDVAKAIVAFDGSDLKKADLMNQDWMFAQFYDYAYRPNTARRYNKGVNGWQPENGDWWNFFMQNNGAVEHKAGNYIKRAVLSDEIDTQLKDHAYYGVVGDYYDGLMKLQGDTYYNQGENLSRGWKVISSIVNGLMRPYGWFNAKMGAKNKMDSGIKQFTIGLNVANNAVFNTMGTITKIAEKTGVHIPIFSDAPIVIKALKSTNPYSLNPDFTKATGFDPTTEQGKMCNEALSELAKSGAFEQVSIDSFKDGKPVSNFSKNSDKILFYTMRATEQDNRLSSAVVAINAMNKQTPYELLAKTDPTYTKEQYVKDLVSNAHTFIKQANGGYEYIERSGLERILIRHGFKFAMSLQGPAYHNWIFFKDAFLKSITGMSDRPRKELFTQVLSMELLSTLIGGASASYFMNDAKKIIAATQKLMNIVGLTDESKQNLTKESVDAMSDRMVKATAQELGCDYMTANKIVKWFNEGTATYMTNKNFSLDNGTFSMAGSIAFSAVGKIVDGLSKGDFSVLLTTSPASRNIVAALKQSFAGAKLDKNGMELSKGYGTGDAVKEVLFGKDMNQVESIMEIMDEDKTDVETETGQAMRVYKAFNEPGLVFAEGKREEVAKKMAAELSDKSQKGKFDIKDMHYKIIDIFKSDKYQKAIQDGRKLMKAYGTQHTAKVMRVARKDARSADEVNDEYGKSFYEREGVDKTQKGQYEQLQNDVEKYYYSLANYEYIKKNYQKLGLTKEPTFKYDDEVVSVDGTDTRIGNIPFYKRGYYYSILSFEKRYKKLKLDKED